MARGGGRPAHDLAGRARRGGDRRNRGVGSALLGAIVAAADERGYARLVLSPSAPALRLFARAGFVVPDGTAGNDRLLVRPGRTG